MILTTSVGSRWRRVDGSPWSWTTSNKPPTVLSLVQRLRFESFAAGRANWRSMTSSAVPVVPAARRRARRISIAGSSCQSCRTDLSR
jgi:hypothetical protein